VVASYDKALECNPDFEAAWAHRGNALYLMGKLEAAIISYDRALRLEPDDSNTLYNRACCYALQGHVELALESLRRAFELNPERYREAIQANTDFHLLRQDQRFSALLKSDLELIQ
jgi:tetratricopeptide (TPR) repeat protein